MPKAMRTSGRDNAAPRGLSSALLRCNSIAELRSLAPLPKDAQEQIDDAVVRVGRERLVIADDLLSLGLTYNLPNPLSVMELYWERLSDVGYAHRVMEPKSRLEDQIPDRLGARVPIYATMDSFKIGIRTLLASERAGAPLDTTGVEQATRRVNEAIEDSCINGAGLTVGDNSATAPGFLNEANVNTQAYVDNEAWDAAGHSGQDIVQDVLNMVSVLHGDNKFGPYTLYIPTDYGVKLEQNFGDGTTTFDITIRERLERMVFGGRNLRVRVADQLPDDRTILFQTTSDVVDMVVGQTPVPISWEEGPGWERNFVIMAFMIPRIKSDYDGQSGIVVGDLT